jgi:hypothetical protein
MPERADDEVAGQPQVVGVAFGESGQLGPFGAEPAGPGAGPGARPAEAGTQEDEAGSKSRRPKPGTAKEATLRDDRDPAKGAHAALLRLDRDDRERDD